MINLFVFLFIIVFIYDFFVTRCFLHANSSSNSIKFIESIQAIKSACVSQSVRAKEARRGEGGGRGIGGRVKERRKRERARAEGGGRDSHIHIYVYIDLSTYGFIHFEHTFIDLQHVGNGCSAQKKLNRGGEPVGNMFARCSQHLRNIFARGGPWCCRCSA